MLSKLRKHWLGTVLGGAACFATGLAIANTAVPGVNSTLNTVFTYAYEVSPDKPTYSATSGAITLAATPQAVCALSGSATKMIRVRRLYWSATLTTAAIETLDLIVRTGAYTAGNGTQPAISPLDPSAAAATAALEIWTANPTTATGPGNVLRDLAVAYSTILTPLSDAMIQPYISVPIGQADQAVILRNANQWLEVNLNASSMTGGVGYCTFEWTEE